MNSSLDTLNLFTSFEGLIIESDPLTKLSYYYFIVN